MSERAQLLAQLRAIAEQINSYYPRPVDQPISAGEEALRERARSIEAQIQALNVEETT